MLNKTMTVKGSLIPSQFGKSIESNTLLRISLSSHGQCKMTTSSTLSKDTTIEIDSCVKAFDGRQDAMRFIEQLGKFIRSESVAALGLQGSFLITVETDGDPITMRSTVKDCEVTYKEAVLVWNTEEML